MPTTEQLEEQKQQLAKAIGRIASGVFIVTLRTNGQPHGLLATWIAQAAFEPPALTLAINKQRELLKTLSEGSLITVNVLSSKNMDIFKAFAKPSAAVQDDRFAGLDIIENSEAGPVFAAAISYLNCRIRQLIDAGDHVVALAEIIGGEPLQIEADPMVHLRKNGFQY